MEEPFGTPGVGPSLDELSGSESSRHIEETSAAYLGRWNRLISTTNWEKGRILCEWREAMLDGGAPAASCTDEAWSRQVGNVTPQHVGRLRRVYQRFCGVYDQYPGLYWSHFQAATDWPDAEMWLEGAVHSGWSVSQMRHQRWEAFGAPPDQKPRPEDVIASELDEDVQSAEDPAVERLSDCRDVVRDATDASHEDSAATGDAPTEAGSVFDEATIAPVRPFRDLPPLPPDLEEAFEAFKLAILHHKVSLWQEIACEDVLAVLEALRQLALAPADD